VELLTPHVAGGLRRPLLAPWDRESRWVRWTPLPLAARSKGALIRMSTPPPATADCAEKVRPRSLSLRQFTLAYSPVEAVGS
jgi:hypothetical protein